MPRTDGKNPGGRIPGSAAGGETLRRGPSRAAAAAARASGKDPAKEAAAADEARRPTATRRTGESVFERSAKARPALHAGIDALWEQGRYEDVAERVGDFVGPLLDADFRGLDAEALHLWVGELYVLQQRMTAVINKLSLAESPDVGGWPKKKAYRVAQDIATVQTKVFRRAVELQDKTEAENGKEPVGAWVVYRDTQKRPGFHSPSEQDRYFIEKARAFVQKGGDLADIRSLDADFLAGATSGQVVEYAVDAWDVARAAYDGPVTPGHTLLAWGQDVLSAGTFVVHKNEQGEISLVEVGTFSGHFRSGIEAQDHLVRHLVAAGVPPERIVRKEGAAGFSRTDEVLGRAQGRSGDEVQRERVRVLAEGARWAPFEVTTRPPPPKRAQAEQVGGRPSPEAAKLNEAMFALKRALARALEDRVMVVAEARQVGDAIDEVLRLSQEAGNPIVYGQTLALLKHLAAGPALPLSGGGMGRTGGGAELPGPSSAEAAAIEEFATRRVRWADHAFGEGVFDPADIFSARPQSGRRARVVATINPKATDEQLRDMLKAGMDVARFNTAHGSTDEQVALMKRIRGAAAALAKPVSIQIDLEGPKIRLGKFANPQNLEFNDIYLKAGTTVTLTTKDVLGDATLFPVQYEHLCRDVKVGEPIFMNDGTVELKATKIDAEKGVVEAEVVTGGKVWDHKGINLPKSAISLRTITDEDLENLEALLPHVDLVASSFVRSPMDVLFLRQKMEEHGRVVPIIAKIERREGLENLERIAQVSDALMVARGDLGVEIGYENVPAAERRINHVGKQLGRPVMVATEVLMSMVKDPSRPSRGDVEGLYAAIFDRGADAIMLGKETSFPKHPAEVVRAAVRVVDKAESERAEEPYREIQGDLFQDYEHEPSLSVRDVHLQGRADARRRARATSPDEGS